MKPRMLYAGPLQFGSTCQYRVAGLAALGFQVDAIDVSVSGWRHIVQRALLKSGSNLDAARSGRRLRSRTSVYDVVFLDNATRLPRSAVAEIRRRNPDAVVLAHHNENFLLPHYRSERFESYLDLLDGLITTRSVVAEYASSAGAGQVSLIYKSFDPDTHRPTQGGGSVTDIGFIGTYENARAESIAYLVSAGFEVDVRGSSWPRASQRMFGFSVGGPIRGRQYAAALAATRISLGFLRSMNSDQHTSRSVEIPACGSLLLAEDSMEHQAMFRNGTEAFFFRTNQEMLELVEWLVEDESTRTRVAAAGRLRCLTSEYSYEGQMRKALTELGVLVGISSRGFG